MKARLCALGIDSSVPQWLIVHMMARRLARMQARQLPSRQQARQQLQLRINEPGARQTCRCVGVHTITSRGSGRRQGYVDRNDGGVVCVSVGGTVA